MSGLLYTAHGDDDRQYLLTIWPDGGIELATRDHAWETWSPPLMMVPELATMLGAEPGEVCS